MKATAVYIASADFAEKVIQLNPSIIPVMMLQNRINFWVEVNTMLKLYPYDTPVSASEKLVKDLCRVTGYPIESAQQGAVAILNTYWQFLRNSPRVMAQTPEQECMIFASQVNSHVMSLSIADVLVSN